MSDYHVRIETGELRAESSRAFRSETAPAVFDRNILSFDVASLAESLAERGYKRGEPAESSVTTR